MSLFQIVVGGVILFLGILKPFLYRPIAQKYTASFSSTFFGFWMLTGIFVSLFFMSGEFRGFGDVVKNNPYAFVAAILKGGFVWGAVWSSQIVNKKSTSSFVFFPFISLSFACIVLNVFLSENLKNIHLLAIILLGVLGYVFCVFGDAKRMIGKEKRMFFVAVFFAGGCSILDHIGIKGVGWYPYLVISNAVLFLSVIKNGFTKDNIKNVFCKKEVVCAGVFTVFYEVIILASMIAVMPVSFVSFFMRLSAPVVMVFSAIKYREQTVKNQLIFGCLAILLALPIIFIK